MLEEVTAILPEVAAYETGLLDFLLRGEITITVGADVALAAPGLGSGTVEVLVEDASGVRKSVSKTTLAAGNALPHVPVPESGTRILAVFRGVDAQGEPLVAVGAVPLTGR
jgi:hypothetical protein